MNGDGAADIIGFGSSVVYSALGQVTDAGDVLNGEAGNDILSGGSGDDTLFGGAGADTIDAGRGDDIVYVDASDNVATGDIQGGEGFDRLVVANDAALQISDINAIGFEAIEAGDLDDTIGVQGAQGRSVLNGNGGNDTLTSGVGDDTLSGGSGNDNLDGGSGNDTLFGGAGDDHLDGGRVSTQDTFWFGRIGMATEQFTTSNGWASDQYLRNVEDVDGDGAEDIVGFGSSAIYVALSVTDGSFENGILATSAFGADSGWSASQFERRVADVNGDGRADIIGFGSSATYVALGQENGTFSGSIIATTSFAADTGWGDEQFERRVADVNGDGRADIVGFGSGAVYVSFGQSDGTFSGGTLATTGFASNTGWNENYKRELGDVNGDGYADIVAFGSSSTYVALGTSSGTFEGSIEAIAGFGNVQGWSAEGFERRVQDMNGDGRADIIAFGSSITYIAYGQSDGTFASAIEAIEGFAFDDNWGASHLERRTGDVNGDGLGDIIGFGDNGVVVALGSIRNANDTLSGGDGDDTLLGGQGSDILSGDRDNDILNGEGGNDALIGGEGADHLTGGLGADAFVFEDASHSTVSASDVITDFGFGGGDKINLSKMDNASFEALTFSAQGDDLRVSLNGTDFSFVVKSTNQALAADDFIF